MTKPTVTDAYMKNLRDLGAEEDVIKAAERAASTIRSGRANKAAKSTGFAPSRRRARK